VIVLAALAAGYLGTEWSGQQRFARAQTEVKDAREKLSTVNGLSDAFKFVGKALEPSVVNINVRKTVRPPGRRFMPDDDMLRRFFPDRDGDGEPDMPERFRDPGPDLMQGTGSGVIIEFDASAKRAFIVTNNHVAGGAEEMTITLSDGRQIHNGKVVGTDPKTDLAVIRIEVDRVIAAKWGNSDELTKGDWVLAFGSPFGYVGSMTHGIVSALNRQAGLLGSMGYENFIQVDAPINPGNSGGPLVNLKGEVIGINTAIASRSGGFQGIGFTIPSNQAQIIYKTLKEKGKVVRGWLGISISDVSREPAKAESLGYKGHDGVLVEQTFPSTPAAQKLQPGDVITSVNGKAVKNVQDLRNEVAALPPGAEVKLEIFRDGKSSQTSVVLGEQPEDVMAMRGGRIPGKADEMPAEALGIRVTDLSSDLSTRFGLGEYKTGAVIVNVDPRSPAGQAGLRPGDLVTRVAGKPVKNTQELMEALKAQDLKKGIRMTVANREGQRLVFIRDGSGPGEE
jgi:serine protease Do